MSAFRVPLLNFRGKITHFNLFRKWPVRRRLLCRNGATFRNYKTNLTWWDSLATFISSLVKFLKEVSTNFNTFGMTTDDYDAMAILRQGLLMIQKVYTKTKEALDPLSRVDGGTLFFSNFSCVVFWQPSQITGLHARYKQTDKRKCDLNSGSFSK